MTPIKTVHPLYVTRRARAGHSLSGAQVCGVCHEWPCSCEIEDRRVSVRRGPYRLPCVCGQDVEAVTLLPHDVADAVQRHNGEPLHVAWRGRRER